MVERYDMAAKWDEAFMELFVTGDYVRYDDYDALAARLAEAERLLDRAEDALLDQDSHAAFQTVLDDIDAFLRPADSAPACSKCDGSGSVYRGSLIFNCPECNTGSVTDDSAEERPVCDCKSWESCKAPLYRDCKRLTPTVEVKHE